VASEVAPEEAHRLNAGLAFRFLAREIGAGSGIDAAAGDRDHVEGAVDLTIAAAGQAVTVASPGGCRYRSDASHPGELGVAGEALCARGLTDRDRGAEWAAAGLREQLRPMGTTEQAVEIRLLCDHREILVAERTRLINRLRWNLVVLDPRTVRWRSTQRDLD
jgi:transposase